MEDNLKNARAFAITAHGDQKYGDEPYVNHLDEVAAVAMEFFDELGTLYLWEDHVIAICYLHDILEDTSVTQEEIGEEFGLYIADKVWRLTDEPGENRKERKRRTWWKIRENDIATYVKICDRIANTRRGGKLDIYRKEFPLFEAALYKPGQYEPMWQELRQITLGDEK